MQNQFSRMELLYGGPALRRLKDSRVIVFGVGGVGGYVVEALARSGVGAIDIVDDDLVCLTNCNRQIIATTKTVGKYKVDVMEQRILDINPHCKVTSHKCFYLPSTAEQFDFTQYDYVVDAIDTVTAKLSLIEEAKHCGTPVISSMGAANKLDPTRLEVADISQTSICPLARVMRRELRKRGVTDVKVVYSKERALTPLDLPGGGCKSQCICPPEAQRHCTDRRSVPGSTAFVPPVAGLIIASEVVKDLTGLGPLED